MAEIKSAFLEKIVSCPICGEESPQRKLQSRLYSPADQESDQHVTRWNWSDPNFEGIKPQYYYLMHCPNCFFTDISTDYEKPEADFKFGGIKRIFSALKKDQKEFLKRISPKIAIHPMTFESAMNAHLAALYIQELPTEPEYKSLSKLARLYLRTGWLWREKNSQSGKTSHTSALGDLEQAATGVEKSAVDGVERMETLNNLLVRRVKSLNLSPEDEKNHPYLLLLANFRRSFNEIRQTLGRLRQLLEQDASGALNHQNGKEGMYGGYPSFFDFLVNQAELWLAMPLNERDCLSMAVKYFTDTYFTELNFDEVEKVVSVSALIVDLHTRLQNYDEALKAIASVYKAGMDGKMDLQRRMRDKKKDGKLSGTDQMQVESKIARIDHVIQKMADKRHEVRNLKVENLMPQIQPILDQEKGKPDEVVRGKLKEAGIPNDVLEALADKGLLGEEIKEVEKKGLFSLFGKK